MATQTRRPGAVLLVGALVVVAVIGSALAGPFRLVQRNPARPPFVMPTLGVPTPTTLPVDPAAACASRCPCETQRWIYLVVLFVLALLLAVALGLLVRWLRRLIDRRAPYDDDAADPDVELAGDVQDHATPGAARGGPARGRRCSRTRCRPVTR